MVIWGRNCASTLSRLMKATSNFAALRVRRACWLKLTTLSTSTCILRATSSFLRPRQATARSSTIGVVVRISILDTKVAGSNSSVFSLQ